MPGKPTYEELEQRIQQLEQANLKLKTSAKDLRESEERHRSIWEHTSDAIFCYEYDPPIPTTLPVEEQVYRLHYGKLVVCNDVAACYFGHEHPEDVVGMKLNELFGSGPGGPVDRMFNKFVQNGYRIFEVESVETLPDGSERHFSNNAQGVVLDGNLIRVCGAYHDITKHRLTEAALRDNEARMRSIFLAAPVGIGVVVDRVFQEVNSRFCEITGFDKDELVGKSARMIYPSDEEYEYVGKEKYRQIEQLGTGTVETRLKRKDNRIIDVIMSSSPLVPNDLSCGVTFTALDITERKRIEDQLRQAQKMESVGHLAGGVAHDFNNMLGVILGHVGMARQKMDSAQPIHHHLEEIRKAADRSVNLTRQLLGFARKQTVLPKALDLNETIAGMLNLLHRLIGEDIDLTWIPSPELWLVKVDPSQIDQILANLCVNARDAVTDVGHVTIATGNTHLDKAYCVRHPGSVPGDYVRIDVSDNGCGIDKAILSQIFEPFFTTKDVGKGTGLGLSTVYGIVKQNNGFITALSEPGSGTTFTIFLPKYEGKAKHVRIKGAGEKDLRGQETILLVEDEPSILDMVKLMLESMGYRVLIASMPSEAIHLAKKYSNEIQLLVTDVVMPEMNGRDLADQLQLLYPKLQILLCRGIRPI